MKETYYKNRKLVSVKIDTEKQSPYFIYREESYYNFLGFKFNYSPEGFYEISGEHWTASEILEQGCYIIKDRIVYFKPYVTIKYNIGEDKHLEFDTEEEAIECYNNLKKEVK